MPFQFECPHCGNRTYVEDRYRGQSGPCAGCGRTVTISPVEDTAGSVRPPVTGGGAIVALLLGSVAVSLFLCAGLGWVMLRRVQTMTMGPAVAAAGPQQCSNHLKMLALAMHNYHDVYQTFPPAHIADQNGTPMHSWRVLLLPFLGRSDLYDQYDFEEPWDGPNNSLLIQMIPSEYRCPDDLRGNYDQASYAMIVGPGTLSDGEDATKIAQITDGTSNTLMFVEAHGSGITWTEPRDLDAATLTYLINSGQPGELNGHDLGIQAALCDGSVRYLPNGTPPEQIRAVSTIGGNEPAYQSQ